MIASSMADLCDIVSAKVFVAANEANILQEDLENPLGVNDLRVFWESPIEAVVRAVLNLMVEATVPRMFTIVDAVALNASEMARATGTHDEERIRRLIEYAFNTLLTDNFFVSERLVRRDDGRLYLIQRHVDMPRVLLATPVVA